MIKSVFALDYWGGMGYRGSLPWPHHREDLQHFKTLTEGHVVVMGRKTWDDPKMPKPLPNRVTFVATNRPIRGTKSICGDLANCVQQLETQYPDRIIWIVGGPDILMSTKHLVCEAHVTHFKNQYRTDVQIDIFKYLKTFRLTSVTPSSDVLCTWVTYKNLDTETAR